MFFITSVKLHSVAIVKTVLHSSGDDITIVLWLVNCSAIFWAETNNMLTPVDPMKTTQAHGNC